MELIVATHNKNKVLEFKKKLSNIFSIKSLHDLNFYEEIPENENSIKKMRFLSQNLFITYINQMFFRMIQVLKLKL